MVFFTWLCVFIFAKFNLNNSLYFDIDKCKRLILFNIGISKI